MSFFLRSCNSPSLAHFLLFFFLLIQPDYVCPPHTHHFDDDHAMNAKRAAAAFLGLRRIQSRRRGLPGIGAAP